MKSIGTPPHIPYSPQAISAEQGLQDGIAHFEMLDRRRSVRFFSDKPVPRSLIETAIRTAGTAPSGAHMQPWTFVAVSDPALKTKIRLAAEEEERKSYEGRMSEEWLNALAPIGTDANKPFLETVPWLVIVFAQLYGFNTDGSKKKHYYVKESVGLAAGLFITSLQQMGLSTLTHTPSPMKFMNTILKRPPNEQPFILFPIGYAADDCTVPNLQRKTLDEFTVWNP